MRQITLISVLLCVAQNPAYACSCRGNYGDTVVQLKILTDSRNAEKVEVSDSRGRKKLLLKYRVSVVSVRTGKFEATYILSGRGGGDCGLKFQQNDVVTFTFFAEYFKQLPELGWCNLVAGL